MDEAWIHHFTPESNRVSAEWIAAGERCWFEKNTKRRGKPAKRRLFCYPGIQPYHPSLLVSLLGSVFILHEHFSMRKLCSKWVLRLLTVNSEHCLQLFQCKKKEFLHKYVIMDETWINHFTSESNRQSAE